MEFCELSAIFNLSILKLNLISLFIKDPSPSNLPSLNIPLIVFITMFFLDFAVASILSFDIAANGKYSNATLEQVKLPEKSLFETLASETILPFILYSGKFFAMLSNNKLRFKDKL